MKFGQLIELRSCQIDFLFSVTCAHAKKRGALNLFIQKLARRSFLFIIGEKSTLFIYFNSKINKKRYAL